LSFELIDGFFVLVTPEDFRQAIYPGEPLPHFTDLRRGASLGSGEEFCKEEQR
jgi:hypothetical protein